MDRAHRGESCQIDTHSASPLARLFLIADSQVPRPIQTAFLRPLFQILVVLAILAPTGRYDSLCFLGVEIRHVRQSAEYDNNSVFPPAPSVIAHMLEAATHLFVCDPDVVGRSPLKDVLLIETAHPPRHSDEK